MYRACIDVGGTFTDCLILEPRGTLRAFKVPSTPSDSSIALLTGRAARVAMITTKGFRDVIEIRRGFKNIRIWMFNLFVPPYRPLVRRRLRFPVEERTLWNGEIATPLNEDEVRNAIAKIQAAGCEAVAICFLHSYRNPTHEDRTVALCRELAPDLYVATSHEILPVWREYERFSTTVVSAAVGPIANRYLSRLEARLNEQGFQGSLLVVQANGLVQT